MEEPRKATVAEREAAIVQEPVTVYRDQSVPRNHKVPPPPAGYGAATWISAGQPVTIADTLIPGGLVYVGTTLRAPSGVKFPIGSSKSVFSGSGERTRHSPRRGTGTEEVSFIVAMFHQKSRE